MSSATTPSTEAEVVARSRAWLRDNLLYMHAEATLRDDDPLLSGGVVDSMGVIEMVEFLQESFGIAIADKEITEDNLGSLQSIGRFVFGKCQADQASQGRPRVVA